MHLSQAEHLLSYIPNVRVENNIHSAGVTAKKVALNIHKALEDIQQPVRLSSAKSVHIAVTQSPRVEFPSPWEKFEPHFATSPRISLPGRIKQNAFAPQRWGWHNPPQQAPTRRTRQAGPFPIPSSQVPRIFLSPGWGSTYWP